jgi:kynurenine formamidase
VIGAVTISILSVFVVKSDSPFRAVALAAQASPDSSHTVTQEQFDKWKVELSNWGRWGKDDQLGALNLITPAKRKEAAKLVKDGVTVSLAHDAMEEKESDNPRPFENKMLTATPISATDEISIAFHGLTTTHMDALAHHFTGGKMYNGNPQSEFVTMDKGATKESIINEKDGIFTRAVLMDIPRLKGVDYLEPGTPIYTEDLEAWLKKAGVKLMPGDALLLRTGRWARRAKFGPATNPNRAGLDASVLPWLRKQDVAVLGSEVSLSVVPTPASTQVPNPDDYLPVHNFVIYALGVTVIDNMDLDAVAEACAQRQRWDFLLTVAPLRLPHGTGSPVNPIAVF